MNKGLDQNSPEVKHFYKNPNRVLRINPYWLLGFIEGEGCFGFESLKPVFSLGQHTISQGALDLIKDFFEGLPVINNLPVCKPLKTKSDSTVYPITNVLKRICKKTSMCRITINGIDVLYFIILPFFSSLSFVSRKYIDFQLWTLGLLIHKYGYFYTDLGRALLIKITKNINNYRYSTSTLGLPNPITQQEVDDVFEAALPFNLSLNKKHVENVTQMVSSKRASEGFKVYLYENGLLVNNAAFISRRAATRYIQTKFNTTMCPKTIYGYIDTDKIYKNRFTFYSKAK